MQVSKTCDFDHPGSNPGEGISERLADRWRRHLTAN